MPGKIKMWSLVFDGENGLEVELFSDEEKFNAAHLACVKNNWEHSMLSTEPMPEDPHAAMAQLAGVGYLPIDVRAFELPAGKPIILPTLAIVIEGGMVASVVSDHPEIASMIERVIVIDYDAEGSEESSVSYVQQGDGTWEDAVVSDWSIDLAKIDLRNIVDYVPCRICAAAADDGEGFDGMCGSCADQAEERGAKTAGLAAIASMTLDAMGVDKHVEPEALRESLRASITDWMAFCDANNIDYAPEDPPRKLSDEEKADQYALSNGIQSHPSAST